VYLFPYFSFKIPSPDTFPAGETQKRSTRTEKNSWEENVFMRGGLVEGIGEEGLSQLLGWCWQEAYKFDCQLAQTIFIFCCPLSIFIRHWRVARKSNFDS